MATLLPVILFAVAFTRITGVTTKTGDGPRPPPLPWFAVGFAALVVIKPVILMVYETVFLVALVLGLLRWFN